MAPNALPERLYGLDLLRAAAILLVFIFHYGHIFPHPEWAHTISKFGWTGVDLFFVLSGYLIASPLFTTISRNQRLSLKDFYLKRFFRIIPPYLLVVAVYFLIPQSRERDTITPLWKYLSFTQNIGLDLRDQATFSHAWSLCIEEQFYLFFPLTLMLLIYCRFFKTGALLLALLFVSGFAVRWFCFHHFVTPFLGTDEYWVHWYKWIYYPTWCRLDGLLAGVSLAALCCFRPVWKEWINKYGNALLVTGIGILTAAYCVCTDEQSYGATIFGFPMVDIGYGAIVAGAISTGSVLYRVRSKQVTAIATYSYVVYLTHKIIIHAVQEHLSRSGMEKESNAMLLLCTAACILVAFLINRLVEKPFLKLRNRILLKH